MSVVLACTLTTRDSASWTLFTAHMRHGLTTRVWSHLLPYTSFYHRGLGPPGQASTASGARLLQHSVHSATPSAMAAAASSVEPSSTVLPPVRPLLRLPT